MTDIVLRLDRVAPSQVGRGPLLSIWRGSRMLAVSSTVGGIADQPHGTRIPSRPGSRAGKSSQSFMRPPSPRTSSNSCVSGLFANNRNAIWKSRVHRDSVPAQRQLPQIEFRHSRMRCCPLHRAKQGDRRRRTLSSATARTVSPRGRSIERQAGVVALLGRKRCHQRLSLPSQFWNTLPPCPYRLAEIKRRGTRSRERLFTPDVPSRIIRPVSERAGRCFRFFT